MCVCVCVYIYTHTHTQGVPDLPNARLMVDSWCNFKTNIPLPKCRGCCNFDVIKGKSSSISELNFPALRDFASKVPRASIDYIYIYCLYVSEEIFIDNDILKWIMYFALLKFNIPITNYYLISTLRINKIFK